MLVCTPIEFIKIYIGQLPLDLEEYHLKEILQPLAELKELKIIKGDSTRGRFDLFCYAFVTMKGNEAFGHQLIKKLQEKYPSWKMNVKYENDRQKMQRNNQNYQPMNMSFPQPHNMNFQQYPPQMHRPFNNYNSHSSSHLQNASSGPQKIVGQKPCNILVRQLWLGGIPENSDKSQMAQIMSFYGIIEQIQIFPKFAFIKYKQVVQATIAFQRAEEIFNRLGCPHGFRIFFSDPSRRAYIVSNNYQHDRQSPSMPILFLGFPPITSATIDLEVMRPVCQKYGVILNEYMRKNTNTQNRSYFLFTFDNVKNAIRAKQQLNKRKDLLGDKRAEVTLLLQEEIILKDHDLSHTEKLFQSDASNLDRSKKVNMNYYGMDPHMKHGMMPMNMGYPMYQNPMMYQNPYTPPYYHQPPNPYYYDPNNNFYKAPQQGQFQNHPEQPTNPTSQENNNIHDFLRDVLSDKIPSNEKKPVKSGDLGRQQDILSKLLGNEAKLNLQQKSQRQEVRQKGDERQPSWSGFLTWKGLKRVGVDGYSDSTELQDYAINIISLVQFKDIFMKEKNVMVLLPSNNISSNIFKEYINQLKSKVGVAMNSKHLMYIMPKSAESDQIEPINENELLIIMQKASYLTQIKDKLIKCEQLP